MHEGCSKANISHQTEVRALRILERALASDYVLQGTCLRGRAAAAVYIASIVGGEPATQKELREAFGVTEVTMRKVRQRIELAIPAI